MASLLHHVLQLVLCVHLRGDACLQQLLCLLARRLLRLEVLLDAQDHVLQLLARARLHAQLVLMLLALLGQRNGGRVLDHRRLAAVCSVRAFLCRGLPVGMLMCLLLSRLLLVTICCVRILLGRLLLVPLSALLSSLALLGWLLLIPMPALLGSLALLSRLLLAPLSLFYLRMLLTLCMLLSLYSHLAFLCCLLFAPLRLLALGLLFAFLAWLLLIRSLLLALRSLLDLCLLFVLLALCHGIAGVFMGLGLCPAFEQLRILGVTVRSHHRVLLVAHVTGNSSRRRASARRWLSCGSAQLRDA
mmetsp:Transcript_16700/g.49997  ORF Transcript_16700/g.49997 Transcript_16700/m.49997 type:complete len:302 (+) Transcript_16700:1222-2127(+)